MRAAEDSAAAGAVRGYPPRFDDLGALRAYLWTVAWRLLVNRAQRPGRNVVRRATTP